MTDSIAARLSRPGLFRLLLAWVVVLHHFCFLALGTWAVYVFFILSGYWIARMWERKYSQARFAYVKFIGSRYWRLLPLYAVCLCLCAGALLVVSVRGPDVHAQVVDPLWCARALAIVSSASQYLFLVPAWSLDVEMQFYLAAPFLAWAVAQGFSRSQWLTMALLAVLCVGSFLANWYAGPAFLPRYLVFFTFGMVIHHANWRPSGRLAAGSLFMPLACVGAVLIIPAWRPMMGLDVMTAHNAYLSLLNRRFCAFLALVAVPWVAYSVRQPDDPFDRRLGDLAYTVYLFHYIVFLVVESIHRWSGIPLVLRHVLSLPIVAVGSLVLYVLVEMPNERWRKAAVAWAVKRSVGTGSVAREDANETAVRRSDRKRQAERR